MFRIQPHATGRSTVSPKYPATGMIIKGDGGDVSGGVVTIENYYEIT